MPKAKITAALVKAPPSIPEGARKLRITDTDVPGFLLELWPSGAGTFWLKYSDERGRTREIKIGRTTDVSVEAARRKAKDLRSQVALTGDPAAERDKRRAVPSFAEFVANQYLPYAKERLRSYRDHESFCRLRLIPAWGNQPLNAIRPADIVELQKKLKEEGLADATLNRYVALARRIFNLALRWEVMEGRNPAQHADKLRERGRDRFLSPEETRRLFQALDEEPSQTAAACLALLALTGARKGEALKLRWDDIDFTRRTWKVERSKSGKSRHIPLSDGAMKLLLGQPRLPDCPWVFPGKIEGNPLEGVRKCWERVKKRAGLPHDLRVHDVRHTFASLLVGAGRSLYEVSAILGHASPTMTARYAHLTNQNLIEAANVAGRIAAGPALNVTG